MAQHGDDCYFFYSASCIKGAACPFRHVEEARGSEVECPQWRQGHCFQPNCPNRHAEIVKNRPMIPCFYESQPGGCTKPLCPFLHTQPKLSAPPAAFSGPPPLRPQVSGPHPGPPQVSVPLQGPPPVRPQVSGAHQAPPPTMGPPPGSRPMVPAPHPVVGGQRPVLQQVQPVGLPTMAQPPPHFWRGPPGPQGLPVFQSLPPGPRPPMFRPDEGVRLIMVPTVEPVIVNVNSEESESDASPVKPIRVVAPNIRKSMSDTTLIHQEAQQEVRAEHNPLDYFLGAKPWIDPNLSQWDDRRSPSPAGRPISPIGFRAQRIVSPGRSRGSLSPDNSRRRSTSEERRIRPIDRRRSHSLDRSRSQSPDWKDRMRRRSPGRPRSRSPVGRRPFRGPPQRRSPPRRFGRSLQRPQERRPRHSPPKKPPAQPVIIPTGRKIISTKKEKKEEDKKDKEEEGEKKEGNEETMDGEDTSEVGVAEVRSLEDIYREKALKSLMEAKKKKVIENRRQKLAERAKLVKTEHPELVKSDEENADEEKSEKSSDTDEEQTSESENEASGDEKEALSSEEGGAKTEQGEVKVESANEEEKVESDIDLAEDVDIEIEAGDRGSDDNFESEGSDKNEEEQTASESRKSDSSEKEQWMIEKRNKMAKSNIKSRLGVKTDVQHTQAINRKERKERIQARIALNAPKPSIKDRLGKREPITEKPNIRSGVIKLNSGRLRDIQEPFHDIRTSRIGRMTDYGREKDIMMVPKIVVRNRLEDFDPDNENSQGSTRSKHSYDNYDSNSDYSNGSDSDDDTISKLTKRKKKLKKLLESEGSDYDDIELLKREKRKIKKLLKRKKEKKEEKAKRRKERRRRERKEKEYSEEEDEAEEEEERNKRRIKIQSRLGPAKGESERYEDEERDQGEEKEEAGLLEEDYLELEEGQQNGEKAKEKPNLTQEEMEDRERLRQEKAQRLQEALQPKSLDDIRRERAQKKVFEPRVGLKEKKPEGSGRRILLAEEKEPSPPKQQVRITFNEESKPPVRQRIRLKRDSEQNENTVPSANILKGFKRERQIYLPPGRKKPDEPDTATKKTVPDREVVDYGELFPSKPDTAKQTESDVPKSTTIQLVRQERKPPPKVEIENAGIKSFAEIMAEKKRKRLLAQQESKKNITPIVFQDRPDSRSSVTSALTPDLRSRLSPVEGLLISGTKSQSNPSESSTQPLQVSQTSAFSSSAEIKSTDSRVKTVGVKTITINSSQPRTSSPVATDIGLKRNIMSTKSVAKELSTQRPNRWKRRKGNAENEDSVSVSSSGETLTVKTSESAVHIPKLEEDMILSPVKARRASTAAEKKNAKASDSLMDFEDELLADVDLNLDDEKSHDELMREMEELLA